MIKLYYIEKKNKIGKDFSVSGDVERIVGKVTKNKHGAPQIDGGYVSVAHCENVCVVALSENPVGVDIESVGKFGALLAVAMPEKPRKADFCKVWTCKEAYFKLVGGSLMKIVRKVDTKKLDGYTFKSILYREKYIVTTCERSL